MTNDVARAYDAAATLWAEGPAPIYYRLAEMLCDRAPIPLAGALVLDLGSGTGAATAAAEQRGAVVIALDVAPGMLAVRDDPSVPGVAGDARSLPFAAGSFDAVVASFSLNHLEEPTQGLAEARRVLRPGGGFVAAVYAEGDVHPAKGAAEAAAAKRGWSEPEWYSQLKERAIPRLATADRAVSAACRAGMTGARAVRVDVAFHDLGPDDAVAWRFGMAQLAPFVASLAARERAALVADALDRLGPDCPPVVRPVIFLTWREGGTRSG